MKLHDLRPDEGSVKKRKRVGRGISAGGGKTAGRGTKGQGARSGGGKGPYFEGGQLPLARRLPFKRGFTNRRKVYYRPVNVGVFTLLSILLEDDFAKFPGGSNYVLTIANGGLTFAKPHDADVPAEIYDRVAEVEQALANRQISTGVDSNSGDLSEDASLTSDEGINKVCLVAHEGLINDMVCSIQNACIENFYYGTWLCFAQCCIR